MWSKRGFFKADKPSGIPPYVTKSGEKPVFIDVGGAGDCGFRAVAAAMLDNILEKSARDNQALAKYLLELHARYFPQQQISDRLMTPVQRLQKLIETPVLRAKFVLELAYALRQAAVDEICKHVDDYRGAFVIENPQDPTLSEGTDPASMRMPTTWVDETAIAALANVVGIPIKVEVVKEGKEIPLSFTYNEEVKEPKGSPITMQLKHNHYLPKVSNPENFALLDPAKVTVGTHRIEAAKPFHVETNDPEQDEIVAKIKQADDAMLEKYKEAKKWLKWAVNDGVLTKETLMDMYIKGMKKSDYLTGRIKQVGIENGNQDFFEKAIERVSKGVKAVELPDGPYEKQITKELIHAVSRAIGIGQMDPSLYEDIAKPSHTASAP